MEIRQKLHDTETALRDFIEVTLEKEYGENWLAQCGLKSDRIEILKSEKEKRDEQNISMQEENRLISFTNFADLLDMIEANWENIFQIVFGDLETMRVFLSTLNRYYDPDSHKRALITHQKHLILGISGFIRNRIIVHRSWREGQNDKFPKIESVRDNLGNLWTPGKPKKIKTDLSLRVGDVIEFVITAKAPDDSEPEYRIYPNRWGTGNVLQIELTEKHIGKATSFHLGIRGKQKYHAYKLGHDDRVTFEYDILPGEK